MLKEEGREGGWEEKRGEGLGEGCEGGCKGPLSPELRSEREKICCAFSIQTIPLYLHYSLHMPLAPPPFSGIVLNHPLASPPGTLSFPYLSRITLNMHILLWGGVSHRESRNKTRQLFRLKISNENQKKKFYC